MLILSIDIDFFVDPVAHDEPMDSLERLDGAEYHTDDDSVVLSFLENQCGLKSCSPVRGVAIRDHDSAWDILSTLADSTGPLDLVHVDAHSDLGMGDSGYYYLLTHWLHQVPCSAPRRGPTGMNLANWLAFAAAAGFVRKIEFVPRRYPPSDLLPFYLDPSPPDLPAALTFRNVTESDLDGMKPLAFLSSRSAIRTVPWTMTPKCSFRMTGRPDFLIVCQSPQFTPRSADRALELARRYMTEDDLGLCLVGPALE